MYTRLQQSVGEAVKLWQATRRDRATRQFARHNASVWSAADSRPRHNVVLCNLDSTPLTHIKFSYLMNVLADQYDAHIRAFSLRPTWMTRRLCQVYQSFGVRGFVVPSLTPSQQHRQQQELIKLRAHLQTKQDVFDAQLLGVGIGVDVYETYLRKCAQPTVHVEDPKLWRIFEQACGLIIFWQDYLRSHPVRAVGMSIDGYTNNQTLTKVAQQCGVPVYAPDLLAPRVRDVPYAASVSFREYPALFKKLSTAEQQQGQAVARGQLRRRLQGDVGVDMPYSTRSAFHSDPVQERVLRKSQRLKVLICAHEFFDAPHSHGGMLFLDFYEWFDFLGRVSRQTDYDWYVKMHPDYGPGEHEVLDQFLQRYPLLTEVPATTSHHQLAKEGIAVALTCYGTIGHEYPLLGVPVINAAYNPHAAYSFTYNPRTIAEYEDLLKRLPALPRPVVSADQLAEFYYMHYYDLLAPHIGVPWWRAFLNELTPATKASSDVYDAWRSLWTQSRHRELLEHIASVVPLKVHHLAEVTIARGVRLQVASQASESTSYAQ